MKTPSSLRVGILATGLIVLASSVYAQGKVVVSHDEWFTGNGYFGNSAYGDGQQFLINTLNWFGSAPGQNVLVYSNNGFLDNSALLSYLSGTRGFNVTVYPSELATNFSLYNAILVGGNSSMDAAGLAAYVFGGGNVFVEGGTGAWSSASDEAFYNNIFLNAVGLGFDGRQYNGLGTVTTVGFDGQGPFGGALFAGVSSVYANNGNNVLYATAVNGVTDQVWVDGHGNGVFGAAEVTATPEPATLLLFGTGLGLTGLGVIRRRRRNKIEQ